MATFTFNAEHFDTMADNLWEGYVARLTKPNKTVLEIIQGSMAEDNDSEFFGSSYRYYQMQAKKTELGTAHTKLTNALVAIETYLK